MKKEGWALLLIIFLTALSLYSSAAINSRCRAIIYTLELSRSAFTNDDAPEAARQLERALALFHRHRKISSFVTADSELQEIEEGFYELSRAIAAGEKSAGQDYELLCSRIRNHARLHSLLPESIF